MALSLTTQWTLVASGIMAHADHVMSGEECEHLMTLVDEEVDGDAYAQWMIIVSEPQRLATMLEELELPPPESHRPILEDAWLIAVLDGERVEAEVEALRRIATRLGVDPKQLELWREAWTATQHDQARSAVAALSHVLGGGAPALSDDEGLVKSFVEGLPTTHEHRAELRAAGLVPQALDSVVQQLGALTGPRRHHLMRRLDNTIATARAPQARERWRELGRALGLTDEDLDRVAGG